VHGTYPLDPARAFHFKVICYAVHSRQADH
jgi:hypothetical protein